MKITNINVKSKLKSLEETTFGTVFLFNDNLYQLVDGRQTVNVVDLKRATVTFIEWSTLVEPVESELIWNKI